jgi:hypothetical protein
MKRGFYHMRIGNVKGTKKEFEKLFKLLGLDESKYLPKQNGFIIAIKQIYIRCFVNPIKYKNNILVNSYIPEFDDYINIHKNKTGLTKEKKEILRKAMGAASSETIHLNDIRDEYKDCDSPLTTVNSKSEIDRSKVTKLTNEKKKLFKSMIGKYSSSMVRDDKIEEFLELIKKPMITKSFFRKCKRANDKIKESKK